MTAGIVFLLFSLLAAVAFAAYQMAETRRWRRSASELKEANEKLREKSEEAQRELIRQEAEKERTREVAAVQLKLLTQTQSQLEEKFRAMAADALQSNSQLFLDRSREQIQH